jgi:hypothetical protein
MRPTRTLGKLDLVDYVVTVPERADTCGVVGKAET